MKSLEIIQFYDHYLLLFKNKVYYFNSRRQLKKFLKNRHLSNPW